MKKIMFFMFAVAALMLTACKSKEKEVESTITLNKTSLLMSAIGSERLTATVTPAGTAVTWSSSDETIVTVSGGLVTAVAVGNAVITAKAGTAEAKCQVEVADLFDPRVVTVTNWLPMDRDTASLSRETDTLHTKNGDIIYLCYFDFGLFCNGMYFDRASQQIIGPEAAPFFYISKALGAYDSQYNYILGDWDVNPTAGVVAADTNITPSRENTYTWRAGFTNAAGDSLLGGAYLTYVAMASSGYQFGGVVGLVSGTSFNLEASAAKENVVAQYNLTAKVGQEGTERTYKSESVNGVAPSNIPGAKYVTIHGKRVLATPRDAFKGVENTTFYKNFYKK